MKTKLIIANVVILYFNLTLLSNFFKNVAAMLMIVLNYKEKEIKC